jgi:hypothetical protein
MVTCGAAAPGRLPGRLPGLDERACWFPDEAAVFLVSGSGATRRVALSGLDVVAPETLLTSDNPRRPVRDAYVDASGAIWVLSSGTAPPGKSDVPGGWLLARYASDGLSEGVVPLPEAARLVLTADARHVTLLMSTGMVGQVMRW